jgi:hypothetical protein
MLPVHPRRGGWRSGAAQSLVAFAVSELRAGRSPHRDVSALAQLGGGDLPFGLAAAEEIDRRLGSAVAYLSDDLRSQRARSAASGVPATSADLLDDELADHVVGALFDSLQGGAVVGCPHRGEPAATSLDAACAPHGDEDGPAACLRRDVRAHLAVVVDRAGTGQASATAGLTVAEQVRETAAGPQDDPLAGDAVLRSLWTGIAALAAWLAYAATL